jgi:glucose/arabinose dehydrogenase
MDRPRDRRPLAFVEHRSATLRCFGCALGAVSLLRLASPCGAQPLSVEFVADGLRRPAAIAHVPGDPSRLFVCEKNSGQIRIIDLISGEVLERPFLDLSMFQAISVVQERGLIGLAFHPEYASNRHFYVCYADGDGNQIVDRFTTSSVNPNAALPGLRHRIIAIPRTSSAHLGGWLGFSPADGYLYVSSGDDEQLELAQEIEGNLLGSLLRIDVDGDDFPGDPERNYAVPPDNPLVGVPGEDEIIAYGFRNPWRLGFDFQTGDLLIGDVGESSREEIDFLPGGSTGALNYAWPCREGTAVFQPQVCSAGAELVDPVHEYTHQVGCAVIGGLVYRGSAVQNLAGTYFFADHCLRKVWSFRYDSAHGQVNEFMDRTDELTPAGGFSGAITTFGEDALGEMYIATIVGSIYRIVPAPPCYPDCDTSSGQNVLDIFDFLCFQDAFVSGDPYADCTGEGTLDVFDFLCFQDAFVTGCP